MQICFKSQKSYQYTNLKSYIIPKLKLLIFYKLPIDFILQQIFALLNPHQKNNPI